MWSLGFACTCTYILDIALNVIVAQVINCCTKYSQGTSDVQTNIGHHMFRLCHFGRLDNILPFFTASLYGSNCTMHTPFNCCTLYFCSYIFICICIPVIGIYISQAVVGLAGVGVMASLYGRNCTCTYLSTIAPCTCICSYIFICIPIMSICISQAVVGSAGVGVMASLYGSKVTEGGMTLELSLEINKKLQVRLFWSLFLKTHMTNDQ